MSAATFDIWRDVKPHRRAPLISKGTAATIFLGLLLVVGGFGLTNSAAAAEQTHAEALVTRDVAAETSSLASEAEAIGADYEVVCGGPQVAAAEAAMTGDTEALASLDGIQDACRELGVEHAGFVEAVQGFTGWITDFTGGVSVTVTDAVGSLLGDGDVAGAVTEMYDAELTQ